MSKIKNIFFTILAAAAFYPAGLQAAPPPPDLLEMTTGYLSLGTTVFLTKTYQWQNDEWNNEGNIAREADGSVYLAATFNVDPSTGMNNTSIFVRKLSGVGQVLWTYTYTLTTSGYARGVTLDGAGNLYVLARGMDYDISVAKLDKNTGSFSWRKDFENSGSYADAYDIGADASGAYVAGTINSNAAIFKFASDNSTTTVTSYIAGNYSSAYAIDVNRELGRIALAGTVYDNAYGNEIWAASYDRTTLDLVWASTYAPVNNHPEWGYDEAHGVKIDKSSNVYVTGFYYSQDTGADIFLGKFDPSGNLAFARTKNGPSNGYDKGFGVALDGFGNIYVAGKMEAYSLNQGDNIWVGKFPPSGGLPSEVTVHRGYEAAYDVEAGSAVVVVGGGFENNYGILNIPQGSFGEPQLLTAAPGYNTGTVNLSWLFENAGNYNYKIQFSTSSNGPAAGWDFANAQVSSGPVTVSGGETYTHTVGDLPVRINYQTAGQAVAGPMSAPEPAYYFRAWLNVSGTAWEPLTSGPVPPNVVPNAPYSNWWETQRGLDRMWIFNGNNSPYSAAARDADGNTYIGYNASFGGGAITKFNSYGAAQWTAYTNIFGGQGSITFLKMKVGPDGSIYAAGAAEQSSSPQGGGMPDAWVARFNPLGVRVWSRVIAGANDQLDYFNDLVFDGAGNVIAGGAVSPGVISTPQGPVNDSEMLLAKYAMADGALVSSTTYKPASVMVGPAELGGLALDGSGNLFAGGSVSALVGSATMKLEKDAAIVKFSAATLEKQAEYIYSNPQAMVALELAAPGADFINSLQYYAGNLYAAGQRNQSPVSPDPVFWVAKMPTADLAAISSVTYNSPDALDASAYALVLSTPTNSLYVSGYENRFNPQNMDVRQKNILLRKYDLNLVDQWGKSLDGSWQNDSAKGYTFEIGSDGYFYMAGIFNAWVGGSGDEGNPGLIRMAEPQTGLMVEQGNKPCSVRLAWIADRELPMGTTFYVQHSTKDATFSFDASAAQFRFNTDRMMFDGEYVSRLVAGLEAGNGAPVPGQNNVDSPTHYFKLGYSSATAVTTVIMSGAVEASTRAVPGTPGVWDRMDRYPNGSLFVVNGVHGGKNPLLRDAAGNVYTAGTFNAWGNSNTAYVRKFSSSGQPVWTRFYADQYENSMPVINSLALDAAGNLYAAGQAGSDSSVYIAGGSGQESATGKDALLIKYDPSGRMVWAKTYDFVGLEDAALGVAVNAGPVYLAGYDYRSGGRDGFIASIAPATGLVVSSVTMGMNHSVFNDVKLDAAGNVYAVGASSAGLSSMDMRIEKRDAALAQLGQFQIGTPGEDEAYALAIDTYSAGAPLLYVAGEMEVNGQQDATLGKFSGSLAFLWDSTAAYNSANENEDEALGVAVDGPAVYVTGTEARYDVNQAKNVFIRKYSAADGQLLWNQALNTAGSNEDTAGGVAAAGREVFAAVDAGVPGMNYSYGPANINGSGYFKYVQISTITTNPTLTVAVSTAQAAGSGVAGVQVAVMGFSQTGGIDPNGIQISTTGASGSTIFSLPAGKTYFVAISSHNMVPTIKDQLSDPNGNFFVELNGNVSKQYFISPRSTTTADAVYAMTLQVSTYTGSFAMGDYLMGEVFITQTGERVGYSVVRAQGVGVSTMQVYNLPAAANGVYGMAVSVPARSKVVQAFMNGPFPSTSVYNVAMADASQLTGSFEVGASTVPPSVAGMVLDVNWAPLEGARVRIERSTCAATNYWQENNQADPYDDNCNMWTRVYSGETLTDAGGSFSFYNLPYVDQPVCLVLNNCTQREMIGRSYNMNVGKAGYESGYRGFSLPEGSPLPYTGDPMDPGRSTTFNLAPATYTLTGVLKYNGMPLPNAMIMVSPDWNGYSQGADSYRRCDFGNGCGIRTDARVRTGADGTFTVNGLTDGNARIEAAFEGGWRSLNEGNDYTTMADNLRVTISSQGATSPGLGTPCRPGRTWVVDSSGTCKGFGNVVFNIIPEGANSGGQLYGNVTFVTTYTITGSAPLVISTSAPLTLMAQESCRDGCKNSQMSFASLAGTFVTNTTNYAMVLSTGVKYYTRIVSPEWAQANSFKSEVEPSTTVPAIRQDFSVVRAGGLHGVIKKPDSTNFKPAYGPEDSPDAYWAQVVLQGQNVDSYEDRQLDEYGEFDFPNLAPGTYEVFLRPEGAGFVWAPPRQTVTVSEGRTTDVKLQLESGLAVRPQIFGLPEISTPSWSYAIIGVPSGTEMNQKKVTELFFSDPEYSFNYSTSTGWQTKYMPAGQYDFYLILGAQYDPGGGDQNIISYQQFGNFIGRVKGVAVQKSDTNPNIGTAEQPIAINILGSIGQGSIAGTMQGSNMFTDADFDRMFGNFEELFDVIPAMMLYDSAGDLRGFSNGMPGSEAAFNNFMEGMQLKSTTTLRNYLAGNPLDYGVWGLPPGRYTAVFNNPNYPPVAKEITLPLNSAYAFSFDGQAVVSADISGVVRSSAAPNAPLEGARVYLKHRTVEKFTLTNSSGAFSFGNLPTGIYRLEVARNGYVTEGAKTSLAADELKSFTMYMLPSESKLTGRIFLSKFPTQVSKAGVSVVAYDETHNVEAPEAYLPKTEVQTDASGNFEITGVVPNHLYKLSAFYTGKQPEVLEITAEDGNTVISDITLRDIPPQISIKVKKSADSSSKVDVVIKSPKQLIATPSCRYNPGQTFDAGSAVTLALVPGPNRTYLGQFTVSSSQQYYTVKVTAGDAGNKMEKEFVYDQVSNAKTEQYIQQESLAGGEIQMDRESEEYSGIELDPGALSYTISTDTVNYANLVGGFFSALPSVRTVKTSKGNLTISDSVKNLMASEVYNMDLSNAQANKPFTLTLKYDKERGANSANSLRIYQQDADGNWQEVPGNYTVDPMLGVLSVDISGLTNAYTGTSAARTPLGRKRAGMSAVVNGRYRPSVTSPATQSGRFAVLTAPPIAGVPYAGSDFDVYNMPNPFSLKNKIVTLSGDAGASAGAYATAGTVIKYHLPAGRTGSLKFVIYNLAGEKVRTFNMGAADPGKVHYFEWDGRNETNQDCASGVYFLMTFLDSKQVGAKAHKMAIIK